MNKRKAILDGREVVRRNHLRRQEEGPEGIAHLVPSEDGQETARRQLVEEVSAIGARNRAAAKRATKRRSRTGDRS
ncbi:MAG: hypothetical protein AAGC96_08425 [Pseudomonadota bacterium]